MLEKEKKFYELLGNMSVGDSDIEGQGGFINLLKIKRKGDYSIYSTYTLKFQTSRRRDKV
jgi:hypothetical protein